MTSRHDWLSLPENKIAGHDPRSIDGNDRTEKTCPKCGLVKITVHPPRGFPWREWRTKEGKGWVGEATPPCVAAATAARPEPVSEVPFR